MATFESYKEIITELKQLSEGIESGNLSESDLQRFADLSQKLYERAVILNFKAMETKVFENKPQSKIEVATPPAEEPKEEPRLAPKTPKEEPTILFDFSTPEEEKAEEPVVTEPAPSPVEEVEIIDEQPPTVETIIEQRVTQVSSDEVQSFYQRFTKVHSDSLNDQLSNSKIESLKTAFGLNDKMRIIGELFNGDSDAFSETITHLDQLSSGETARKQLSEIAVTRGWDAEHELVEELVKTVNRKFD